MTETMRTSQLHVLQGINPLRRAIFLKYGMGKSWIALQRALDVQQSSPSSFGILAIIFCKPHNIATWEREIDCRLPNSVVFSDSEGLRDLLRLIEEHPTSIMPSTILLVPHHLAHYRKVELESIIRLLVPAALIVDESTKIKNPKASRTQNILFFSAIGHPDAERLVLSGNPIPENELELWSQFQFIYGTRNPLGPTVYSFQRRWFVKGDYGYVLDFDKREEFFRLFYQHSFGQAPEDIAEFEKLTKERKPQYLIHAYHESEEQRELLDILFTEWALPNAHQLTTDTYPGIPPPASPNLEDIGNGIELNHKMAVLQKAQQIASGFYYDDDKNPIYLHKNPKLELLEETLQTLFEENKHRQIIVWHAYVAERPPILDMLLTNKIKADLGPSPEVLRRFLLAPGDPDRLQVILMPLSTPEGLNELQWADVAIFFSNVYSQELRDQAETRNTQMRQRHPRVLIIDLASPTLSDMDVVTALQAKNFTPERMNTTFVKYNKRKPPPPPPSPLPEEERKEGQE